jgi:tRNA(Ile)-lysidine synthase
MDASPPRIQDLPPKWARFCLSVATFAAEELGCGFAPRRCLVACSGGADSSALLLLATLLCRRAGGDVAAVHLDHGLRPESAADAAFVATFCKEFGVPLVSETLDVSALAHSRGLGLEEAGREARYDLFERARRETGSELVLVGHQLNDLAEDQLLRLMRGSGWPALGGMAGYDPERSLLRPLLLTPKAALEEFLQVSGRSWREDETNLGAATARNRVRNGILPAMLDENPAYLAAAARLWRQARLDEEHLDAMVARAMRQISTDAGGLLIPATLLRAAPAPLRQRIVKAALEQTGPGQPLCDGLFQLDSLWRAKRTGKTVRFPGDKEARIVKQGIRVQVIDRKKTSG